MQQGGCTWSAAGSDGLGIRTGGGCWCPAPRGIPQECFVTPVWDPPLGRCRGSPALRHWGTLGCLLPGLQLLTAEQGGTGSLGLDTPGGAGSGLFISWEEKARSQLQLRNPGFLLFDFKRKN